ncbi:MAG: nucleotidyl transferase AbiEii/AbiGii toxin family protein [Xanthobacteraceae bacterium]
MPPWQLLLHRTADGLSRLRSAGQPAPDWVLGGGTALMIRARHRTSRDIDAFIEDPQYLSFLSPRLTAQDIWACDAYEESYNHLRLIFREGEIDFIVAARITELPSSLETVDISEIASGGSHEINVEHPVEIAIKKLAYRGPLLKVRDIFDIAVVDSLFPELLRANLFHVAHLKQPILGRLNSIPEEYLRLEIDELDIADSWRLRAFSCRQRVGEIIATIPS